MMLQAPPGMKLPSERVKTYKHDTPKRRESMGMFHVLDDDDFLDFLEFFDEKDLLKLSLVSHAFYIFAEEEQLVFYFL
jgi:hypothetical protein